MHVTFHTQYYPPEMGAPPARISEFARGLAARGWKVDVVTALPNYPSGTIFPAYRGKRYVEECIDGIPVKRTWIRPDASGRVSRRLIAALSFAVSSLRVCARAGRGEGAIITETPPLTLPLAGAFAAKLSRRVFVVNVSDLWPGSLVDMGVLRNRRLIRIAEGVEARCYRAAKLITAQAPDIVSSIKQRFPDRNVQLLSNGVDTRLFRPDLRSAEIRSELGVAESDIVVIFAGLHGFAQGLDVVVDAAERLKSRRDIRFLFVGDGPAKASVMEKAQQLELPDVWFLPPANRDQIARMLASSDIAIVTLSRPILGAVPSKVYEAMASGLAVVAATGGTADQFVQAVGAGVVVEPGNAEQIADAIAHLADERELRANCGKAGRQLASEQFDRQLWINKLAQYLETAVGCPS